MRSFWLSLCLWFTMAWEDAERKCKEQFYSFSIDWLYTHSWYVRAYRHYNRKIWSIYAHHMHTAWVFMRCVAALKFLMRLLHFMLVKRIFKIWYRSKINDAIQFPFAYTQCQRTKPAYFISTWTVQQVLLCTHQGSFSFCYALSSVFYCMLFHPP